MKINIHHWTKPIPIRSFDYEATLDDYEPGHPIGHGQSKREAVNDLFMQIDNDEAPYIVEDDSE